MPRGSGAATSSGRLLRRCEPGSLRERGVRLGRGAVERRLRRRLAEQRRLERLGDERVDLRPCPDVREVARGRHRVEEDLEWALAAEVRIGLRELRALERGGSGGRRAGVREDAHLLLGPEHVLDEEPGGILVLRLDRDPEARAAQVAAGLLHGRVERDLPLAGLRRDAGLEEAHVIRAVREPVSYTHLTLPTIYSV